MNERVTAEGEVLRPLDLDAARGDLEAAFADGYRAIAIVLMHGWRWTAHEAALADVAREIGFTQVSASHVVGPLIKLVGRGDTSVVDAYLSPVLRRYVDRVVAALGERTRLYFMQSNGGLTDAAAFQGKDAILSGPAGGIVGMAKTAAEAGFDRVIGFDMGGTSTDVSHFAGAYERTVETMVAGVRVRAPMLEIHTVAAGGGSICHYDGARFRVGPDSAGAVPGPACYRRGGPLTITDCNVVLGKIRPDHFPAMFGPGRRSSDRCRGLAGALRRDRREGRPVRAGGGRGLRPDRGRQYGQCDQADLDRARPRRHPLHPGLLRRRRRPACLPGRRRARNRASHDPSARRSPQRLWNGPRRHDRAQAAHLRPSARARGHGRSRRPARRACRGSPIRPPGPKRRSVRHRRPSPRRFALRRQRFHA